MKEIAAFFNLPFEDIQEITYEILQPMYDNAGECFLKVQLILWPIQYMVQELKLLR